jgi:hypothetical protein
MGKQNIFIMTMQTTKKQGLTRKGVCRSFSWARKGTEMEFVGHLLRKACEPQRHINSPSLSTKKKTTFKILWSAQFWFFIIRLALHSPFRSAGRSNLFCDFTVCLTSNYLENHYNFVPYFTCVLLLLYLLCILKGDSS